MSTTETLTLTDFLLARIAEDDRRARDAFAEYRTPVVESYVVHAFFLRQEPANAMTAAERMRAAVEELMGRLDHYERILESDYPGDYTDGGLDEVREVEYSMLCETTSTIHFALRHLASIYADHPDYRQEWWWDRA